MSNYENKMLDLQWQVRQNQQELMDYVKELEGWENEIKQKEEQLKQQTAPRVENLPPVRNSLLKKKKKKVIKQRDEQMPQKKRIPGYDYRAWDKFDIESACAEVDDKASSSSEYETDEEWEEERRKKQAEELKEQGNQYFKESKYDEAIECYTQGIDLDHDNALLYANRGMALLKQQKYAAAEQDCTEAITRDCGYAKAFSRRATARIALKKFQEAHNDYSCVLKLEPGNKMAKMELAALDKILNPVPELASAHSVSEVGIVKPIYKSPADRSKKPLKRITIEEIGIGETDNTEKFKAKLESDSKSAIGQDLQSFDRKFTSPKDESRLAHGVAVKSKQKSDELTASLKEISQVKLSAGGDSGCEKVMSPKSDQKPSCCGSSFAVPTGSFQFQSDWKVLRNRPEEFYSYIRQIEPNTFPRIFGEALDADMLSKILEVLNCFYRRDHLDVFPVLEKLTNVKRFATMIMFMSAKDKQVLQELFELLSSFEGYNTSTIDLLRKLYDL